jgi:hypothetical protein
MTLMSTWASGVVSPVLSQSHRYKNKHRPLECTPCRNHARIICPAQIDMNTWWDFRTMPHWPRVTERPRMRHRQHPGFLTLLLTLSISIALCTPSLAGDITLLSIGPRFGFSGKTPILGKEQKYYFDMIDVAAVFKLPWVWPLGGNVWGLETRLITSAGLLQGAGESGLIVTVVPDLALTGWGGTGHLRRRSRGRIFQQLQIRCTRLRRPGSNHRDGRSSHQPLLTRLCRVSCPTLLRRRPLRTFQSRRGHVYCGTWIPVLTWARQANDSRARTIKHHPTALSGYGKILWVRLNYPGRHDWSNRSTWDRMLKKAALSPAQPRRAKTRRSANKAAASEEAKEVRTALCVAVCPSNGSWRTENTLQGSGLDLLLLRVEPLSEARMPLVGFFSILLWFPP